MVLHHTMDNLHCIPDILQVCIGRYIHDTDCGGVRDDDDDHGGEVHGEGIHDDGRAAIRIQGTLDTLRSPIGFLYAMECCQPHDNFGDCLNKDSPRQIDGIPPYLSPPFQQDIVCKIRIYCDKEIQDGLICSGFCFFGKKDKIADNRN